MSKEALLELADRVEREGPSRHLDADIFEAATDSRDLNTADKSFRERGSLLLLTDDDRLNWVSAPAYTTSLDAAVTLVPEGCGWHVSVNEHRAEAVIGHRSRFAETGRAITKPPAAALTAAALRALTAL